jgi:23S rRNA (guanine745-N1)-methyltransferase
VIRDVAELLACPVCGAAFESADRFEISASLPATSLACPAGHSFDLNRKGFVDLVAPVGRKAPVGDTAAMVEARAKFLNAGHYEPIALALIETLNAEWGEAVDDGAGGAEVASADRAFASRTLTGRTLTGRVLADIGCGPGFYSRRMLEGVPALTWVVALDVSVAAVAAASRAHDGIGAVRCNVKTGVPILDDAVDAVAVVFAPRNPEEWHRILVPGGLLLVVIPTERHLIELRERGAILEVEPAKRERLLREVDELFVEVSSRTIEWSLAATPEVVDSVVSMGPSAFHDAFGATVVDSGDGTTAAEASGAPTSLTASVQLNLFRAR